MPRILLATVAILFAAAVAAQTYRWVDKDGKVHYSQTPPPPAEATNVQKRSAGGSVVEGGQQSYATQQAAKNHPVTIYTAENCTVMCKDARALLSQRGVPFREVAVSDENTRAELKKVSGGDEVPVLTVGKQATKGYSADAWHTALDSAGYPRNAAPLAAKAQKPAAPAADKAAPAAAKAETPQQAAAAPAPSGRYAPPAPDAKEAKQQADQAARTAGRYAAPAAAVDPKAPAAATAGPYAPK